MRRLSDGAWVFDGERRQDAKLWDVSSAEASFAHQIGERCGV
jgi:hypothetical protein